MRFIACLLVTFLWMADLHAAATDQPLDPARQLYDRVMEEFQRGDFQAAHAGFRFFLELHARSPLAENAQFWLAECEFRQGRYRDAIASFSKVLSTSPRHAKVPAATWKMGLAYAKLGLKDESRILFERIRVEFPGSPEAALAKKALDSADLLARSAPASRPLDPVH